MTLGDSAAFARILAELGEIYAEAISPVRATLYFQALASIPLERVQRAANHLIKSSHFFPKPADFFQAVSELAERPREVPALYPHVEPVDPELFKKLLAETVKKLSQQEASP